MHDHSRPPLARRTPAGVVRGPLPALRGVVALLRRRTRRTGLVLALAPALLVGGGVGASVGCEGHVRPRPAASFWCVRPGAEVRVLGGQWGLNASDEGASVLWAQGWWHSVEVDGVQVIRAVYLPVVGR